MQAPEGQRLTITSHVGRPCRCRTQLAVGWHSSRQTRSSAAPTQRRRDPIQTLSQRAVGEVSSTGGLPLVGDSAVNDPVLGSPRRCFLPSAPRARIVPRACWVHGHWLKCRADIGIRSDTRCSGMRKAAGRRRVQLAVVGARPAVSRGRFGNGLTDQVGRAIPVLHSKGSGDDGCRYAARCISEADGGGSCRPAWCFT